MFKQTGLPTSAQGSVFKQICPSVHLSKDLLLLAFSRILPRFCVLSNKNSSGILIQYIINHPRHCFNIQVLNKGLPSGGAGFFVFSAANTIVVDREVNRPAPPLAGADLQSVSWL